MLVLQASACPAQSIDRLMYVAAFAVSGYSATAQRTQKPFNPLLGETFEFIYPEKGYRAIAEKVRSLGRTAAQDTSWAEPCAS